MSGRLIHVMVDTEGNGRNYIREAGFVVFDTNGPISNLTTNSLYPMTYHAEGLDADIRGPLTYATQDKVWGLFLWLRGIGEGRLMFWSDNPAFDWNPLSTLFHEVCGGNPFGWSARRVGDLYAGLNGNAKDASSWKRLRVTKHDHNPVNDAMGNVEALCAFLKKHNQEI